MSSRLARSAGLIGVATMASRLLGVGREIVLARIFGASATPAMDAFNVAFRVPNLVRDLFAEGAMTAAFVPTFTKTLQTRGREAAWHLGNLVINALLVATGAIVVVAIVFADPITRAIASGGAFAATPGKLELTTQLTRIMMPFLTTVAVAVAVMGMLNALHRFFLPALSPAMFNVVTILGAFLIVPLMPSIGLPDIAGIAIATVLGGLAQIAIQWPALRKEGFRYRATLDFRDPDLRRILTLMGPATLGLAAVQINVLVNTSLATSEPQGAVTWLQVAFRLMYLPIGLFGVSVATAALPDLSKHAAAGDREAMRRTVSAALRMMSMLNVPATIGLVVLAHPIVELLLEYNLFGPEDTAATAAALMFYAPGLVGYSAVKIASPTFFALGDSRTPATVSVASIAVNLALNLTLIELLGFRGLALGTAIAAIFNASTLLYLLGRRLDGLDRRRISIAFGKILVASILMGAASYFASEWLADVLPSREWYWRAVRVSGAIGAGVLVLMGAARLLAIAEFNDALASVTRRLVRR
jgi:putative peptidoglycan lipid II flippase